MAEGGEDTVPTEVQSEGSDGSSKAGGSESAKPKGIAVEAEKKGFVLMEQAEAKVKSASGFLGKLMG